MRAWEEFLLQQEKELGPQTVQKWLRPLKILRFDVCNLHLEARDSFMAHWFAEHMHKLAQNFLSQSHRKPVKIHLTIAFKETHKTDSNKTAQGKNTPSQHTFSLSNDFDALDPDATFDDFYACQSSLLAHKILSELASQTDTASRPCDYNPIYLYGRSGCGKTHLLMAAASALQQKGKKALYLTAHTFTEHVVEAIRKAEMRPFRQAYRGVDALLIDDIEVFSRKTATQEEFFHTFNTLHVEGKQIILSASIPPSELKFIEPRLVSRFEWGIVVPVEMPNLDEMRQILLQKAKKLNFPLEEGVTTFLLTTFGGNTKRILRALEALVLRTHLNQGLGKNISLPLSLKTAQSLLKDLVAEEEKALLTPGKIIRAVAEYYGIRIDDILSKSQTRECALPRQIAMHLCRQQLHLPFMKIGDIFSRDHSTVMASVKQIQKGLENKNHEIAAPFNSILKLLEH